jgi:Amt family ammonium transporter
MLAKIRKIGSIGLMLYYLLVLAVPVVVNAQAAAPTTAAAPAAAATPAPQPPDPNGSATGAISDLTSFNTFKDVKNPTVVELAAAVGHNRVAINIVWTLVTGYLVMFMQAGFAMVETGMTRAKNINHTMTMNFMIYPFGMLGFYICGFAFMFGGVGALGTLGGYAGLSNEITWTIMGKPFGMLGNVGYFLTGPAYDVGVFTLFLFEMVFMDTTATIPTGAMAERWKWSAFCLYGCAIGTIMYPVFGNWVWGGGWLSQLGVNFGLGHGYDDFAGSTVVHMQGGVIALVGAWILGPRIGKYNKNGSANTIPAHNMPMAIAGCFILAFGWFGFNPGSTLAGADLRISVVAVNTMLASAWGAMASMLWIWFVRGNKPDPGMLVNGMLAGLVAITGPSAFVSATGASILGFISGILVVESCFFVEKVLKIDDPVGAISVHGTNGAWGCISLGLFADGTYGQGWNGVGADKYLGTSAAANNLKGVTGLFYGDGSQLMAQIVGVAVCFVTLAVLAWIVFMAVEKTIGNRVSPETEIEGLDIPEMGSKGYCGMKYDPASENITSH